MDLERVVLVTTLKSKADGGQCAHVSGAPFALVSLLFLVFGGRACGPLLLLLLLCACGSVPGSQQLTPGRKWAVDLN